MHDTNAAEVLYCMDWNAAMYTCNYFCSYCAVCLLQEGV